VDDEFPAYKVHPPKLKHTEHLVTSNFPMVKVQEGGCKVYKFDGLATFECVDELKDAGW
jgi:hypothetical protein